MALDPKGYFYDTIADQFDAISNRYDTIRRLEIVFDELLAGIDLRGLRLLDVGCGTGWFSQRAAARGARVTSLDIGVRLLQEARKKASLRPVAADAVFLPFAAASFDAVISSECIEHTLDPKAALREIFRVARPGAPVVITVPNQTWHFAITFANAFNLRPFHGYENWLRWSELREAVEGTGARVEELRGFHIVPPLAQAMTPLIRRFDAFGRTLGPLMLNLAVLARR